jgi:hypothetical protein
MRQGIQYLLVAVTAGYWAFGKAFGYIGYYPIYIGEIALGLTLVGLVWCARFRLDAGWVRSGLGWLLAALGVGVLQAAFEVVFDNADPIETVRNLAVLYYAVYGVASYWAFRGVQGSSGRGLVHQYAASLIPPIVLAGVFFSALAVLTLGDALPKFPGTTVTVMYYKATDAIVGVLLSLGLVVQTGRSAALRLPLLGLAFLAAGRSRAALLGLGVWLLATLVSTRTLARRVLPYAAVIVALLALGLEVSAGYRPLSLHQLTLNLRSLVSPLAESADVTAAQNAQWRLDWWIRILDSAGSGSFVFEGLGWETNLAREFGFGTGASSDVNALRHPHNALVGILGRGGWLVAAMWLIGIGKVVHSIWRIAKGGSDGVGAWARAFISTVPAIAACALTDVFLESPQNAIPMWIVVGMILGSHQRGAAERGSSIQTRRRPSMTLLRDRAGSRTLYE